MTRKPSSRQPPDAVASSPTRRRRRRVEPRAPPAPSRTNPPISCTSFTRAHSPSLCSFDSFASTRTRRDASLVVSPPERREGDGLRGFRGVGARLIHRQPRANLLHGGRFLLFSLLRDERPRALHVLPHRRRAKRRARLSAATASSSAVCARLAACRAAAVSCAAATASARARGHIVDAAGHGGFRAREVDVALVTRELRGGRGEARGRVGTPSPGGGHSAALCKGHRPLACRGWFSFGGVPSSSGR